MTAPAIVLTPPATDDAAAAGGAVCYALTLGDFEGWRFASDLIGATLTAKERAALAWAALRSLPVEHAELVAETVIGGAGAPMAPFGPLMDDATWWASIATRRERKAYLAAIFLHLAAHDRRAFLDWAERQREAA